MSKTSPGVLMTLDEEMNALRKKAATEDNVGKCCRMLCRLAQLERKYHDLHR